MHAHFYNKFYLEQCKIQWDAWHPTFFSHLTLPLSLLAPEDNHWWESIGNSRSEAGCTWLTLHSSKLTLWCMASCKYLAFSVISPLEASKGEYPSQEPWLSLATGGPFLRIRECSLLSAGSQRLGIVPCRSLHKCGIYVLPRFTVFCFVLCVFFFSSPRKHPYCAFERHFGTLVIWNFIYIAISECNLCL